MDILEQKNNGGNMIEFKDFSKDFQSSYFNNSKAFNNSKKFIERLDTNKFFKKYLDKKQTNIFEVIQSHTKLKPFYDIDKGFETE
jgi:hypothetical protein